MVEHYNADIFTYFVTENTFKEFKKFNVIAPPKAIKTNYLKALACINYFKKLKIENGYDIFLMNGYHSVFAAKNNHPNFWYSFGPSDILLNLGADNIFKKITYHLQKLY